jgi:hypothetical protein
MVTIEPGEFPLPRFTRGKRKPPNPHTGVDKGLSQPGPLFGWAATPKVARQQGGGCGLATIAAPQGALSQCS